jgi:glycosyltransferase involved in cell wall biosynthesis
MKILFVTGSLGYGGAERHSITLANRLAERDHECHTVYVKNDPSQLDRLHLRGAGTVGSLYADKNLDLRAVRRFAAHLRNLKPSVVVAANPYALMYTSLAQCWVGDKAPKMVTFHTTRLQSAKEQVQMLIYRPFFWAADCAVFVCETQRRYWMRRRVFGRRNEVTYNGVDTEQFRDVWGAEERRALRGALGFRDGDFVIGICAVLRPEKNHVQLVDAIAMLRRHGIPAKALLIGDGPMRGVIEDRARAAGVDKDIVITGFQQDVQPFVAACEALALCSTNIETFSLAALEAMALGRPVVHSKIGGAAEMIRSGDNGFLFPVGDTQALVERLARLADGGLRSRMGRNARETVETRFSEAAMIDRYERTLLELNAMRSKREHLFFDDLTPNDARSPSNSSGT